MDEPLQDNLTSSTYGALVIMSHLMNRTIGYILTSLQQDDRSTLAVFAMLADTMVAVVEQIEPTPESADAHRQFSALLRQHRAFIVSPAAFSDNPARNEAVAEIQEMDAISIAALDRLARRLGIGA